MTINRRIGKIIVHQTGTTTGTLESVRNYHVNVLGWKDIGYHFLIERDATVRKGRSQVSVGAHCQGDNLDSLGVCCVGAGDAFPIGRGYMTPEMFNSLLKLLRELLAAYPTITAIYGHRERPSGTRQGKTCPGFSASVLRELLL